MKEAFHVVKEALLVSGVDHACEHIVNIFLVNMCLCESNRAAVCVFGVDEAPPRKSYGCIHADIDMCFSGLEQEVWHAPIMCVFCSR